MSSSAGNFSAGVVPAPSNQTRRRQCDAEKDTRLPKKCHAASEILIGAPRRRSARRLARGSKGLRVTQTTSEEDVLHLQDGGSSPRVGDHLPAAPVMSTGTVDLSE